MQMEAQDAYVLHTRPYRNTSLLVDALTEKEGFIRLVARSARGPKSRYRGLLQPFLPLSLSAFRRRELYTLRELACLKGFPLSPDKFVYGFYLNELIVRLVEVNSHVESLFCLYKQSLQGIAQGDLFTSLRCFERDFLALLGYGIDFLCEAGSGVPISAHESYSYHHEFGFSREKCDGEATLPGSVILAMSQGHFTEVNKSQRKRLVQLMRFVFSRYLKRDLDCRQFL